MTALHKYEKLEALVLWRQNATAQKRELIASVGEATLMLHDSTGAFVSHWSLAAMERIDPASNETALFRSGLDSEEEIEVSDRDFIKALAQINKVITRQRKRPGRMRKYIVASILAAVIGAGAFWLPSAIIKHTSNILPEVTQAAIGEELLKRIRRLSGDFCYSRAGVESLNALSRKLADDEDNTPIRIVVLPSGLKKAQHLPGNVVLINKELLEDYETSDVVAGYVLGEALKSKENNPIERLLNEAGVWASIELLTSGEISQHILDAHAETIMTLPYEYGESRALIERFEAVQISPEAYAKARDITGQSVLEFLEAAQLQGRTSSALDEGEWSALQNICS